MGQQETNRNGFESGPGSEKPGDWRVLPPGVWQLFPVLKLWRPRTCPAVLVEPLGSDETRDPKILLKL